MLNGKCGGVNGWTTIEMSNGLLKVVLLIEKGADIYSIEYMPAGIDFLAKTPWGLNPPNSEPRPESGDIEFMWNYEGAWQELFPNTNAACKYQNRRIPFHGEAFLRKWSLSEFSDDKDKVFFEVNVRCDTVPLLLFKRLTLFKDDPTLYVDWTIENQTDEPHQFIWGQHIVLGAPFLSEKCIVETAAKTITTLDEGDDSGRLALGQNEVWPYALTKDGDKTDISKVLGPTAHVHDDALLTDLDEGWISVKNPDMKLAFMLEWDASIFPWIVMWQPYGVNSDPALNGFYGLGIEPWVFNGNLEKAIAAGKALTVQPGGSLKTFMKVKVIEGK